MHYTRLYDGTSDQGLTTRLPALRGHRLKQTRRARRINRRHETPPQEGGREEEAWQELWLQAEAREQELLDHALKSRTYTDEPYEVCG